MTSIDDQTPTTPATGLDTRPDPRFVWDGERARVAEANEEAAALFGEVGILDLIERPFAPQGRFAAALTQLMATASARQDTISSVDGRMPHPEGGNPLDVTVSLQPLSDGRIGLAVAVGTDAEPDSAEARVAALGEAIAAPGALFAADGTWLAGNDASIALLGEKTPDLAELLGDPKAALRLTGHALAEGLSSATFRIGTRFGARLARVTLTRALDPNSGGAAVAAYFNDIADRARVLAAPAPAAPNADTPATATSQTAGTDTKTAALEARALMSRVGHELRTPLNAILGFSEVMANEHFGPMGNEKYLEYARDIHTGGEHLLGLVDDLLEMARSENGRRTLSFEAVDLADMVHAMSDLLRAEAADRGLTLFAEISANVPPVVADARSLRQVLINLLGNAIKFTKSGGTITLGVRVTDDGGVALSVVDTGIGMDDAQLAAALEPFGQVEEAQADLAEAKDGQHGLGRGLGLGLPLAKTLVEANKATFEIESTPGEGTRVRAVFPPTAVLAT
ncbi:sensor histidine kinase [Pyruvatibacter sp.]